MTADPTSMRIDVSVLTDGVAALFAAVGCVPAESNMIAEGLVEANLFGHDSHGIGLIPTYLDNLRDGCVRIGQTVRIVADHGAIVGLDGQLGFGQSMGAQAMALAVERARTHGLAMVGLANSHHLGRIGRWAERCAEAGMVSVHFVNVLSPPLVAPWGGTDARLCTNPLCIGVPHSPHPLILDYATSMVALGKARVALNAGTPMAEGLLLDANGRPTTDPSVMFSDPRGALLPFAEHKGFALAVMCEILGGVLSGGHVQHHRTEPEPMVNNMLSLVFSPDRLSERSALATQVQGLAEWLRASPAQEGGDGVRLPGEPEQETARERRRLGIALPRMTRDALAARARAFGLADFAQVLAGAPASATAEN